MNFSRLWTIARLELLQRVRAVSWYVLLGIFALLLLGVTLLAFLSFGGLERAGAGVYSTVVYITLLLVILVSPTLSGNSINGDRDAATLAPVQVTLATTGEILFGKFVAAWITGLAFAVVAAPFLLIATLAGNVEPATVVVSLAVLVVETGIIAGIGVALSGILGRPLFSVAATYLVVAALAIGTVIGFGLVGTSITSEVVEKTRYAQQGNDGPLCEEGVTNCWDRPDKMVCGEWETYTSRIGRYDQVWWMLAANPFVILADATPIQYDRSGYPADMFGYLKLSVRQVQIAPELERVYDECAPASDSSSPTPREVLDQTVPSWFVGLGVQILLAAGLLGWAYARTRTPARALPPGTRIA
jgi:ABC-type transport system involved in multi-copper enzyme maturation permease subunit